MPAVIDITHKFFHTSVVQRFADEFLFCSLHNARRHQKVDYNVVFLQRKDLEKKEEIISMIMFALEISCQYFKSFNQSEHR